tara:strand:- start:3977 stop:4210 length:234 start_codon:yes stop_codon:yes gene_type:complete
MSVGLKIIIEERKDDVGYHVFAMQENPTEAEFRIARALEQQLDLHVQAAIVMSNDDSLSVEEALHRVKGNAGSTAFY